MQWSHRIISFHFFRQNLPIWRNCKKITEKFTGADSRAEIIKIATDAQCTKQRETHSIPFRSRNLTELMIKTNAPPEVQVTKTRLILVLHATGSLLGWR